MHDEDTQTAAAAADKNTTVVVLDCPLTIAGDQLVKEVVVRKPTAGALRGLALTDLLRMQTEAIQLILPRITTPMLHKPDVAKLDPADMVALATAVVGFLVPKSERQDYLGE